MISSKFKQLLTQEITEDDKPLFPTTVGISRAIAAENMHDCTNTHAICMTLGFIFRGERACSPRLREALLRAVRTRLSLQSQQAQEYWVQQITSAIASINTDASNARKARATFRADQFKILLERAAVSAKHFIIKSQTAEQEKGINRADQLSQILLEVLGIFPKKEALPTTQYWFLLPYQKVGDLFWEKLFEKASLLLSTTESPSWAEERIRFLEQQGFLQVYIVPPYICGCPLVVYDPDSTRDTLAFSFSYHCNNEMDIIRWDDFSVYKWKENVFERFQWQDPNTKMPFDSESAALNFMREHPEKFAGYRSPFPF